MNSTQEIKLTAEQIIAIDELQRRCAQIAHATATAIEANNAQQIADELTKRIQMLAETQTLMAQAVHIYEWAKGQVAEIVIAHPRIAEAKQEIQRLFINGRLAKYSAMYTQTETAVKDLRNSIEGLRTLLSYEKELIRQTI